MAAGCPAKCAKFLLIVFNIIFWLSGAALLAVGIWLRVDDSVLKRFEIFYVDSGDKWFEYAAYVLIGVGAFTFVTGFAGCCGAIRESPCLLGVYIFLLVIVMLVEITAGVLAFIFRNEVEKLVTENLSKSLKNQNYTDGLDKDNNVIYSGFGTGMNLFQQQLKCCGVNGSSDYDITRADLKVFNGGAPFACCALLNSDSQVDPQSDDIKGSTKCSRTEGELFPEGCDEGMKNWLHRQSLILIGLGIGIACLEIFGIIFAVCLCRNPTKESYD